MGLIRADKGVERKIDLPGFFYFAIFAMSLTIFCMQVSDWGFSSNKSVLSLLISFVALIFLLIRERRAKEPFLELSLFKKPAFSAINISVAITQFVMMIAVFRTIYLQEALLYTPLETGLIMGLTTTPVLFFSYLGGFLSDKVNPKLAVTLGFALLIGVFFLLGFFSVMPTWGFCVLFSFSAIGITFILTPSYSMAMTSIVPAKLGIAFGMIATLRMLAASLGLSLIHMFVSINQKRLIPTVGEKKALISSFSSVHFLLGFLMIAAAIASLRFQKRKSAHKLPESPAEGWD
jgi:MFS family permease